MADDETRTEEEQDAARPEITDAPGESSGRETPAPPKTFWWRALLMIAVVIVIFTTIRDLARQQAPVREKPAPTGQTPTEVGTPSPPIPREDNATIEEAPSAPPAFTAPPPHGYYGYPYPRLQPYYPQYPPVQGYTYPPQYPWYPYFVPWYPPHYPWNSPYPYGYSATPGWQHPNRPPW